MMKQTLTKIKNLLVSSLIFGSVSYSYLSWRSDKNLKEYLKSIKSDTLKDASRLTNQSFGISWGFQADDTIMDRIDSGDMVFMKYQCSECLSCESMIRCFATTLHMLEEEYQSVGFAFRSEETLQIVYNEFGRTKNIKYTELVSLPYLRELSLQKSDQTNLHIHNKLKYLLQEKHQTKRQSSIEFANRMMKELEIKKVIRNIRELLTSDQVINIRTETNRTLRSL